MKKKENKVVVLGFLIFLLLLAILGVPFYVILGIIVLVIVENKISNKNRQQQKEINKLKREVKSLKKPKRK